MFGKAELSKLKMALLLNSNSKEQLANTHHKQQLLRNFGALDKHDTESPQHVTHWNVYLPVSQVKTLSLLFTINPPVTERVPGRTHMPNE